MQIGQTFGSYQILATVGKGGMGEVYRARDTRLGRDVALKILADAYTQDQDRIRRFRQEATAASALNHPGILTIHEAGDAEGRQFIATELVDGETVRACLMLAVQADGASVLTVEGLAEEDGRLHPLQQAFWDNHALQCGYCTPGMLITAYELLRNNPRPSEAEIREGISGNICRCTGYVHIVKAIEAAAETMAAGGRS